VRLSGALQEGRPSANVTPAIAIALVIVLSIASVGVLLMARSAGRVSHVGPASASRLASSPTPISTPTTASAPRLNSPCPTPACPNLPAARFGAGITYDLKHGYVLMFGGANTDQTCPPGFVRSDYSNCVSNETWTWDGSRWTLLHPSSSPPARAWTTMAYDPRSQHVILVGGGAANSDPIRNDMWSWNGATWTELHPPHLPSLNSSDKIAIFDRDLGSVVMIATEYASGSQRFVIWQWTGSDWTSSAPPGAPPVRFGYGFAYDPEHHQEVLTAGYISLGHPASETWLLRQGQWSQASPGSVGPTGYTNAAYDEARHQLVVMVTTGTPPQWADETWTWDGVTWTRLDPKHRPPGALSGQSLVYDVSSGRVLMFGGKSDQLGSSMLNQTWAWDGTDWIRLLSVSPTADYWPASGTRRAAPLPPQTVNWPAYATSEYGYSLRYSPRWFYIADSGGGVGFFSNKKDVSGPIDMGLDGLLVGVDADCQYLVGGTVISKTNMVVDTVPTVRYVFRATGPDGTFFSAIATIEGGGYCYRIWMLASQSVI
jgi:hypothetical protein